MIPPKAAWGNRLSLETPGLCPSVRSSRPYPTNGEIAKGLAL